MESNRISPGQNNPPAQVTGAQSKSGEEAFHDMAKSKGGSREELAAATSERTKLTRTKKVDRSRKKETSLFLVTDDDELLEEAIYRTVMVDGFLFTLRLLAVA